MDEKSISQKMQVTCLRFNQSKTCFICAIENYGVKVFNVEPLEQLLHIEFSITGSISICEMLERTNLVALVAGGKDPMFRENLVRIWDARLGQFYTDYELHSKILNVKLRRERIAVVAENEIHIFSLPLNSVLLKTIQTAPNPQGICEVTPNPKVDFQVLVFPGQGGNVQVELLKTWMLPSSFSIDAHNSRVVCVALNDDASRLATASEKGTLIRIFDLKTREKLIELRRGSENATIHCLNFDENSEFLCATSGRGTVHIFGIKDPKLNRRSSLPVATMVPAYAKSQWGFANFSVSPDFITLAAFGENFRIYAISYDGSFHKQDFSSLTKCHREVFDNFLHLVPTSNI